MVKYTNIPVLKINKMSQERYDSMKEAGEINPDELYITPGNESTNPTKVSELENDAGYVTNDVIYSKITNCITEIPQDIKLELVDGTLTLKTGSKVIVPNGKNADGSNRFDEVVIASDLTSSVTSNETKTFFMVYNFTTGKIMTNWVSSCSSGATVPSGFEYGFFYNTTDNTIFNYTDVKTNNQVSFPLAIFTSSSSGITSIDQVFNGFGYIGSTVFALPSVKGLIPNGRNEDGSLKNIEFTVNNVLTTTTLSSYSATIVLGSEWINCSGSYSYNEVSNFNYEVNTIDNNCIAGYCEKGIDGKITSFTPKQTFQSVDRNDSSWLSGLGFPSDKYIDLTLGASGTTYTAPANGWFMLVSGSTSGSYPKYAELASESVSSSSLITSNTQGWLRVYVPVKKGEILTIFHGNIDLKQFRFVYSVGEE